MQLTIIEERKQIVTTCYSWDFTDQENSGGWSIDCDKYGRVDERKLLRRSRTGHRNWIRLSIKGIPLNEVNINGQRYTRSFNKYRSCYTQAAIGVCLCGAKVFLDGFTNTCETCGRDYDMSGWLLAQREQWGEETGETAGDILRV